jgi:hypothetical protein
MRTQQTNTRDPWHRRSKHDTTRVPVPHLIGVGVDGAPAGRDAVVLAAMLARATQAELMLIAIFRVQLGSVGRRLLGDAPAPILIAPRPRHAATV